MAGFTRTPTDACLSRHGLPWFRCWSRARWWCCWSYSHYDDAAANVFQVEFIERVKEKCSSEVAVGWSSASLRLQWEDWGEKRSESGLRKGALTEFRIPHLSPLPLQKGEARFRLLWDHWANSIRVTGQRKHLGETSTGSSIPPRPISGEGLRWVGRPNSGLRKARANPSP